MNEFLDVLKKKYNEEVGWSFTFFEGVTFIIYLLAINQILGSSYKSVWGQLLFLKISDLVGAGSLIMSVRILDILLAYITTIFTVFTYREVKVLTFNYFQKIRNFEEYTNNLVDNYKSKDFGNQAIRIYLANDARDDKIKRMKILTTKHGLGLVTLGLIFSALLSIFSAMVFMIPDIVILFISFLGLLFIQWRAFVEYVAHIVPRIALEKVLRSEPVSFADGVEKRK